MSEKEEDTKKNRETKQENKESHSAPYQFYVNVNDIRDNKLNKTELPTLNHYGCLGWCLGLCIGGAGAVAYMYLAVFIVALLSFLHSWWWLVIFVEALGPVLAFLCAKKVKYMALFWGFLLPYILVLLLFGACFQLNPTLFPH